MIFILLGDQFSTGTRGQFTSDGDRGRRYRPYVFTEQGVAMLSAILKSKRAIKTSIQVIEAFV